MLSSSSSAPVTPAIGFFNLPAEIRNMIYRLAFEKKDLVGPRLAVKRMREVNKPGSVLRVSKCFSIEAAPFIYSTYSFNFPTLFEGMRFIIRIGKQNSAQLTGLYLGTFWYRYREAAGLRLKYEDALATTSKFLAQRCPRLDFLEVGDLSTEGEKNDWRIKTLVHLKTLVDAFPQLTNVSYSARKENLRLTSSDYPIPTRRTAFDVDDEIEKRKEATKTRRSAAGKKANAVKRARKAAKSSA